VYIFLSKFLPPLVYPLGLGIILLICAFFLLRKKRTAKILISIVIIMLWGCSTAEISNSLVRSLERQYSYPENVPHADAIVVLGGGTEPAIFPRKSVEINSAGDRVLAAAKLYREGKAPVLILSGGNIDWLNNTSSTPAEEMAELLSFMGIPTNAMILDKTSKNTYENAVNTKEIMEKNGYATVLLVTSAMHMPRAVKLFEKQEISIIPIPIDYYVVEDTEKPSLLNTLYGLLPNASNLALTTNALKEYIGIFTYNFQSFFEAKLSSLYQ